MKKLLIIALLIVGFIFAYQYLPKPLERTTSNSKKENAKVSNFTADESKSEGVIAGNLQIPWSMVFLPDESILFTERPGRVRLITNEDAVIENPVATINEVKHIGEGGLLGIELHPNFETNNYIYLYFTYSGSGNNTLNKVVRYTYRDNKLVKDRDILTNIPGASNHNGGRMKFGSDGFLYITTGDSQNPSLAQDKNSLAGKILRVTDDGEPAPGNPFNNRTYSFGHRNPQGLAWDTTGTLWSTEHGPSARDELNRIEIGKNYGWPTITGSQTRTDMVTPVINSGNQTWAPSGLSYTEPYLYFAGLRSNNLYKFNTENPEISSLSKHLSGEYGRLRDVVLGPDGYLYILTSNMDGRAITHLDGDKIIRLHPDSLK